MKKIGISLCVVGILLSLAGVASSQLDDHGNACGTATPLVVDALVTGALEEKARTGLGLPEETDVDFFRVDLPSSGILRIQTSYTYEATDTFLNLWDPLCRPLAADDKSGFVYNSFIEHPVPPASYYISVRPYDATEFPFMDAWGNGRGTYNLHVDFEPAGFAGAVFPSGMYLAVLAHENRQRAAVMATRDVYGNIARFDGAVWTEPGGNFMVVLTRADGVPNQAFIRAGGEEYGVFFSNHTGDTMDATLIDEKRRSRYVPAIPVSFPELNYLRFIADTTNLGGTLTLAETVKAASFLLDLAACGAIAASGGSLTDAVPCRSRITWSMDLYLPQHEAIVFHPDQFHSLTGCHPVAAPACLDPMKAKFDEKVLAFTAFWNRCLSCVSP